MGPHRRRPPGPLSAPTIAQVVPDVPTFAVDDGFSYAIPDGMDLAVGRLVRVPLGGRRVRGYVVGLRAGDTTGLKPIGATSGDLPIFDDRLMSTLRWAAIHYVAPMAALLGKAAPPNLPRTRVAKTLPPVTPPPLRPELAGLGGRPAVVVGPGPWDPVAAELVGPVVSDGGNALVVCPTLAEAQATAASLAQTYPDRVVMGASGLEPRAVTRAWSAAAGRGGLVVVGTREVAAWPVRDLGLAVLLGDGRRGLKDRQTPTVDARELLRRRAGVERFSLVMAGAVPTTDALAPGPEVVVIGARPWPLVEVVDRGDEPPGGGFVTSRVRRALQATAQAGGRAFVFTHRRGYAPAFRCTKCRTVRRCGQCGARAGREDACPRCGAALGACAECGGARFEPLGAAVGRIVEELSRALGAGVVGEPASGTPVVVGTERDMVGLAEVALAVVVDADGLMLAPHYRAEEDALRLMARVAATVGRGRGRRCMVQTGLPGHPVIAALRRGEPLPELERIIAGRAADGFPPAGELLVIETQDTAPDADDRLRAAVGERGTVLGPAPVRERSRWLVQGADLRGARLALRGLVQGWREAGARVRVDADPIDL